MNTALAEQERTSLRHLIEPFMPLGRSGLLPALQAAQGLQGWLSEPIAQEVATALRVPLADVHGVIEFYSLLYNKPVGKRVVSVCTDVACSLRGGQQLLDHLCRAHRVSPGDVSADGSTTIQASPCLGLCEHAPAALDGEQAETNIDVARDKYEVGRPRSVVGGSLRLLTRHCGTGSTTTLSGHGDYLALRKALGMTPQAVIEEIKASGLVGRGGAAFPTGVKWAGAAAAQVTPRYVVCNADESEPGTFKDRILLLDDPHTLIEGMLIAGYAIAAERGYIYLRGEYAYILPALEQALGEARGVGLLGEHVQGSSFAFDIEVRLGAGAYICGEETALFESIEGKRGLPRIKPPFPTTHGLFGRPTVINNVETLFNVPLIVRQGATEYRGIGTDKSPGPKLFCLSGDVARPGVYEVPFGLTLRELLEMAGGVADGRPLRAVLFGGAAGAFATPNQLDVRLTFEDLRAAGLPLGSGVVMVLDETRDLRLVLERLGHFFADESCGKCYPCQLGTQRQKEVLERIASGRTLPGDLERLQDVGWTMTDASLCGLGQTAASAVLSAIKIWPELFAAIPSANKPAPRGGTQQAHPVKRRPAGKSAAKSRRAEAARASTRAAPHGRSKARAKSGTGPKRRLHPKGKKRRSS
jgi:NADH-quinone oxidoreductase subunit F